MARPRKNRKILGKPPHNLYKPAGVPSTELETITLTLDELEALRLADYEALYQEDAAKVMNISRQTFGNIVISARQKCAEALLQGKMLLIEGGDFEIDEGRKVICDGCGRSWRSILEDGRSESCPIAQPPGRRGRGRGYGRGQGRSAKPEDTPTE